MSDHNSAKQSSQNLKTLTLSIYEAATTLKELQDKTRTSYQVDPSVVKIAGDIAQAAKNEVSFDSIRTKAEILKLELSNLSDQMRSSMTEAEQELIIAMERYLDMVLAILATAIPLTNESLQRILNGRLFETARERALEAKLSKLQIEADILAKKLESQNVIISESIANVLYKSDSAAEKVLGDYEKAMESIRSNDEEINNLRLYLSNKVLHGAHSDTAIDRFRKSKILMGFAYAIIALTTILLFWSLEKVGKEPANYAFQISRVLTVLFLTLPITLLIKDAARYRATGNRYWQTALDLATLNPFISNLSQPVQEQIKAVLAPQVFFAYEDSSNPDGSTLYLQESITKLVEALGKAKTT